MKILENDVGEKRIADHVRDVDENQPQKDTMPVLGLYRA